MLRKLRLSPCMTLFIDIYFHAHNNKGINKLSMIQ
jgi:hypothetical protein